jgi:hypothetical protein
MPGDIGEFRPIDAPGIPPECLFFAGVTPESVRQVQKFLDYEKVMKLCCRVKKHPNCCVLCAANNDCTRIPMHVRCRCVAEPFICDEEV